MFYEETWIDGKLMWRSTPRGQWFPATEKMVSEKLRKAQDRIAELEREVAFQKDNVKALETARDYYIKMLKKLGVNRP